MNTPLPLPDAEREQDALDYEDTYPHFYGEEDPYDRYEVFVKYDMELDCA